MNQIVLDSATLDLEGRRVIREEAVERLTAREVALLQYLIARSGRVVPRAEIFTEVWGYAPNVVSRAVDATMRRLRKKIEVDPADPVHLFSTYGQGYRFEYGDSAPQSASSVSNTTAEGLLHHLHLGAAETRLFGRQDDLSAILEQFEYGAKLLTVLATGGMGKTRIAEEIGRVLVRHETYAGGVWFCDLVDTREASDIIHAVANTLKMTVDSNASLKEQATQLGRCIGGLDTAFVILDNFEQIAELASQTLGIWIQHAPEVRFLVTSRQRLVLDEEHVYELKPLHQEDAVALFLDRAHAINPHFVSDGHQDPVVHQIVETLDGIPLALQLAAGRARLLSAKQMRERLHSRFRLLRKSTGMPEGRQTTMRAAIDWSWNLLCEAERRVLQQVAVFRGGFTLESAEAIVDLSDLGEEISGLESVMAGLADKSMLFVREGEESLGDKRICTFDSIRYYALEKLQAMGDVSEAEQRHAQYYLYWIQEQNTLHLAGNLAMALELARQEVDNLQMSFERLVSSQQPSAALSVLHGMSPLLRYEGWFDIGVAMSTHLVGDSGNLNHVERAQLYRCRSRFFQELGQLEEARTDLDVALTFLSESDTAALQHSLWLQNARLYMLCRNYDEMNRWMAQVEDADAPEKGVVAQIFALRAEASLRQGDLARAEELFTCAWREGAHGVGGQFRMRIRSFQGLMRCILGDLEGGRAIIEEMYRQRRRLGKQTHIAVDLDNLGQIDLRLGDAEAAAVKLRESVGIWQRAGEERKRRGQLISLAVSHQICGAFEAAERAIDAAIAGQNPQTADLDLKVAMCIKAALSAEWGRIEESRTLWKRWSAVLVSHSELSVEQVEALGRYHIDLPRGPCLALITHPQLRIPRSPEQRQSKGLDVPDAHHLHFILLEYRLGVAPFQR